MSIRRSQLGGIISQRSGSVFRNRGDTTARQQETMELLRQSQEPHSHSMRKIRPSTIDYPTPEKDPRRTTQQSYNPTVMSTVSKVKSVTSVRMEHVDQQREMTFNTDLASKLSYEWKNIYRALLQADVLQRGKVNVKKFNQICLSNNTQLTKEELRRLVKLSGSEGATGLRSTYQQSGEFNMAEQAFGAGLIDYQKLSKQLGLHRNALDLMSGSGLHPGKYSDETTKKIMQTLAKRQPAKARQSMRRSSTTLALSDPDAPELRESHKIILKGGLKRPTPLAREVSHPLTKTLVQATELCHTIDKERSGLVPIQQFLRIVQACGLKVDNI